MVTVGMKRLILCLFLSTVCVVGWVGQSFAGPLQRGHLAVIAASTVVGGEDTTPPEISSGTAPAIDTNGTKLTVTFTEACVEGGSYSDSDWTLTCSTTGPLTVAHNGGTATAWDLDITGGPVQDSETDTCTIAWAGTANGVEDGAGNDLPETDPAAAVTNNSEQGGGGETRYVGFPNTAGTANSPVGSWALYGSNADRTYGRLWTATENGTIQAVKIYQSTEDNWQAAWLVVYNGTTLVGKVAYSTLNADAWCDFQTIVVEGGQSLNFSTNDVLRFGIAWDNDASGSTQFYRDNGASDGGIEYDSSTAVESAPPATASWSTSASQGMGVILQYETR